MMEVVVQKYGGASVAISERIKAVAQRVAKTVAQRKKVVVVLSAMGDTTDRLMDLAKEITESPPAREMDMLLSTGEQMSIALFSMAIQSLGISAVSLTGPQVGILAGPMYTKAKIMQIDAARLNQELERNQVVVVAGFQGVNVQGDIVTLGRGGSDTSAVALATVLNTGVCEIYTDVDGVYTADPRMVPTARRLQRLSWDEMLELASSGAKVLQSRSVEIAKKYGVRIHVRSSFNESKGTMVMEEDKSMEKVLVRGIAHDSSEAKITIRAVPDQPGIAAKIFGRLAKADIVVDMIIQNISEDGVTDVSFTVTRSDLQLALRLAGEVGEEIGARKVVADEGISKVSVVGVGMRSHSGIAAKMFEALSGEGINIEAISTSEIKISCLIREKMLEKAVRTLHAKFNLDKGSSES